MLTRSQDVQMLSANCKRKLNELGLPSVLLWDSVQFPWACNGHGTYGDEQIALQPKLRWCSSCSSLMHVYLSSGHGAYLTCHFGKPAYKQLCIVVCVPHVYVCARACTRVHGTHDRMRLCPRCRRSGCFWKSLSEHVFLSCCCIF